MKKVLLGLFIVLSLVSIACSSGNRAARTRTSTSGMSWQKQSAATDTASVSSEPMKIWINPIEYQLEVDTSVSNTDDGYLEYTYNPPDTVETYYSYGDNAGTNLMTSNNVQFIDSNTSFDRLTNNQQRAIFNLMKEYGLDGFLVTMIDEYTGTLSQTQQSKRYTTTDKNGNKQTKENNKITVNKRTTVFVRGIALKLKFKGTVDEKRADEVRKAPKTYNYNYIFNKK